MPTGRNPVGNPLQAQGRGPKGAPLLQKFDGCSPQYPGGVHAGMWSCHTFLNEELKIVWTVVTG